MKRAVAHGQTWWMRAFIAAVILLAVVQPSFLDLPGWAALVIFAVLFGLASVRAPRADETPVEVAPPVRGRWTAVNSPGTKVPSHGLRAYGQTYAIDILHPSGASAKPRVGWSLRTRAPESFSSFGEPVRAMAAGTVVATTSRQRDHRDRGTWPALLYLFVLEGFVRDLGGSRFILGNHVIIDHGGGLFSASAHLRRGSVRVRPGDRVEVGEQIGEVGNSGNSSEPHLHVQLMDDRHPSGAAGIPFRWSTIQMEQGDVDPAYATQDEAPEVAPGLPANGQIFEVPARTRATT